MAKDAVTIAQQMSGINQRQRKVIDYLCEENCILRAVRETAFAVRRSPTSAACPLRREGRQ